MGNGSKVASNFLWRFFERFGAQLLNIVVGIILARKLGPGPSGQIAVVLAVINILKVFADSGMANALIQKKDPDDLDFSSVFFFNLGFSLLLYLGLFLAAPRIAVFYQEESYVAILRVLGLLVVISGLYNVQLAYVSKTMHYNVQLAYVSKTMQFKRFFFATLGGTLFSGALSIAMVYLGFGIWSLVALQLSNFAVNTLILWFTVSWRPKRMFSAERLKGLLSYGWKLLAASFLDTLYLQIYSLVIGKRYPKEELGQFDKGRNWPDQITTSINASLDSVLLPVLSAEQDNVHTLREMTRRAIKTSSFVMMPMMAGLAACATPLVRRVLSAAHGQPQRHQGHGAERYLPEAGSDQENRGDQRSADHPALRRTGDGAGTAAVRYSGSAHQRLAEQEAAGLSLLDSAEGSVALPAAVAGDGGLRGGGAAAFPA